MATEERPGANARSARNATRDGQQRLGRAFGRLFTATGCSSLGDGLVAVAFPLLILRYTRAPILIAGVALADRLPALLLALPAGVLADRLSRRMLAVIAQIVQLIAVGVFGLLLAMGAGGIVVLYLSVMVIGSMEQLYKAAAFAALPAIVDLDQLGSANSRLATADAAAEQLAGQGLGGMLVAVGRSLPFVADAASFGISAALIGGAIPAGRVDRPHKRSLFGDLTDGLRWFAAHPVLPVLAALIGSFAFCQFMMTAILVLYARLTLHMSSAGYGFLEAGAGVGTVLGSLLAGRLARRMGPIAATVAAGAVASVAYIGMGALDTLASTAGFLALESAAVPVGVVASMGLRQSLIPVEFLGRVGMVFRVIIYGAMPLGALTGGLLASGMPYTDVFIIAGTLQLAVVALLGPRLWRRSMMVDLIPASPVRRGAHFARSGVARR